MHKKILTDNKFKKPIIIAGAVVAVALVAVLALKGGGGSSGKTEKEKNLLFPHDLVAVKVDEKWGYADKTGELVINPQFDDAETFSENVARVKLGDLYGLIDKTGSYVVNPSYPMLGGTVSGGLICFANDATRRSVIWTPPARRSSPRSSIIPTPTPARIRSPAPRATSTMTATPLYAWANSSASSTRTVNTSSMYSLMESTLRQFTTSSIKKKTMMMMLMNIGTII